MAAIMGIGRLVTRVGARVHTRLYRWLGGAGVGRIGKAPILLLTTRGHRSGKPRTIPLLFLRDGDAFVVVASYGGAPNHPAWYVNLLATPAVEIEVRGSRTEATARTANDEERERYWPQFVALYSKYDAYQEKTDRTIPVVVLKPRLDG
jgi:F420H(2)-dependent quinone reductase